ncbi:hypothetical protein NM04_09005 [Massilia aurea]|uniref:PD-(D/E)XK nuclease superfamily protein n=1 Tax=Massilia aurea TaxID=373040 RepID=A0A422QM58_9BURK|nr:hypothetical protein [Massilia aurea]RNF31114.1 hypothetical protein NM04_09005 [Massilia aurea]
MRNFFGSIQRWFSGDYYGRHLGLILQEIGQRRPEALTTYLADAFGLDRRSLKGARFQAEYSFTGANGWRRADLAVFLEDDIEPFALIEIKYHDKPMPKTDTKPAQLSDYQSWRKREKQGRYVLLLSREMHSAPDIEIRRWTTLARHLRPYALKSDLVAMLVDYLQEEGNAMQDINGLCLTKYIKRYLCNRQPGANNLEGPVEFSNLLKNMQLMSGNFHLHFKSAWKSAGIKLEGEDYVRRSKVATIDFKVWNRVKEVKVGKPLLDDFNGLRDELKDGGVVSVYAQHALGHNRDWMRVRYGIDFNVAPHDSESSPPIVKLFANIVGGPVERACADTRCAKSMHFKWVTTDAERGAEKVEEAFRELILQAIESLSEQNVQLQAQQKRAFTLLTKSLRSGNQPTLEVA